MNMRIAVAFREGGYRTARKVRRGAGRALSGLLHPALAVRRFHFGQVGTDLAGGGLDSEGWSAVYWRRWLIELWLAPGGVS